MEHSGFFNAVLNNGVPDKKYNANDYSDNLAVVISNGVLRDDTNLKVTASGMVVSVAAGRGWINGHYYFNDSVFTFSPVVAPTGGSRIDRVMLRCNSGLNLSDATERKVSLVYVMGTVAANPVAPAPVRSGNIYDLVLADINVPASAAAVTVTDKRGVSGLCDWLYSNNKGYLFKRYTWEGTLTSATSVVQFNLPQFTTENGYIEVYVNGILENETTDYTQNNNIITFDGLLTAGTVVTVNYYKSIDGTGIASVADEITELQNQYAALSGVSKFVYTCTGLNDNVSLSQIAEAFHNKSYVTADVTPAARAFLTALGGNTYLQGLTTDAQITIDVVGRLGVTSPYGGAGTAANRYRYFALGIGTDSELHLIFDFKKTEKINIACANNTNNIIFYGINLDIRNANVSVSNEGAGCAVAMMASPSVYGKVYCENSKLVNRVTGKAIIANYGKFINCLLHTKSATDDSFIIEGKTNGVAQLIGCTCYAYTANSQKAGIVFFIDASSVGAVITGDNLDCSVVTQWSYYQHYLCKATAGKIFICGVKSPLQSAGTASLIQIIGQV